MELHGEDFLIDYLGVEDPKLHSFDMGDLSTSSANALRRSMVRNGGWPLSNSREIEKKYRRPISLSEISVLTISDIRDLRQVGEGKVLRLLEELRTSILRHTDYVPIPQFDYSPLAETTSVFEVAIETAENFEQLSESMLQYLKSEFALQALREPRRISEIDDRTEIIWRHRLPWLTDSPLTLDALGKKFDITRERIRQIQNLATRFPFPKTLNVNLLFQTQDVLLESSSVQDFLETLSEEGFLDSNLISLGRIRYLALEFGYIHIASDVEKSIYRWANQGS
jgi:hypothetical protein